MTRMHLEAGTCGKRSAACNAGEFTGRNGGIACRQGITPRTGVNLDHWRADECGGIDLLGVSCDEQRNANAGPRKFVRDLDGRPLDRHVVFGQVVGVHIDDRFIANGKLDTAAMKPIARCGYDQYAVVESVFAMTRPEVADAPAPRVGK